MNPPLAIAALALALSGCCGSGDTACTQAQYNAIGASMLNQPGYYGQPAPMISTSCTNNRGIINCLSY